MTAHTITTLQRHDTLPIRGAQIRHSQLPTVEELPVITLDIFSDARGHLVPIDLCEMIPFTVVRIFWVFGVPHDKPRGGHAHRLCNQFLVCNVGHVRVDLFDGINERTADLEPGGTIHIPPKIFSTEHFADSSTVLTVYCDQPYDREDYIQDRQTFTDLRRLSTKQWHLPKHALTL